MPEMPRHARLRSRRRVSNRKLALMLLLLHVLPISAQPFPEVLHAFA